MKIKCRPLFIVKFKARRLVSILKARTFRTPPRTEFSTIFSSRSGSSNLVGYKGVLNCPFLIANSSCEHGDHNPASEPDHHGEARWRSQSSLSARRSLGRRSRRGGLNSTLSRSSFSLFSQNTIITSRLSPDCFLAFHKFQTTKNMLFHNFIILFFPLPFCEHSVYFLSRLTVTVLDL